MASEDDAREALARFGNSLLFELDAGSGLGLSMPLLPRVEERYYDSHPVVTAAAAFRAHPPELGSEYDRDPLFLYWYARSAPEMPLIQFLVYYQVLEYYFPVYSRTKTVVALREKLREIYGVARDADVAGILQALRANRRAVYGGEKDQLRHTIEQCVSAEELRDFLDEEKTRFYSDPSSHSISTVRVTVGSSDQRNDVARRVYEIRNRIVHTKSEHDDLDPLLPLDPEVGLLRHDIDLVRFLARKVLSASAQPLKDRS
jgi:hypothetical protein